MTPLMIVLKFLLPPTTLKIPFTCVAKLESVATCVSNSHIRSYVQTGRLKLKIIYDEA
jgi:hypothetical protein